MRVIDAEHVLQDLAAVAALILDIMDSENGLDVLIERTGREHQVVVDRHQSGLPVVAVDDIRLPVEVRQHLEHCLGVVREALCIVVLAVDLTAREIVLIINEVIGHAVLFVAENAAVLVAPAETDIGVLDVEELFPHLLADRRVQRTEHAHIMSLCREGLGQRACHVAQTAGLDERSAFAGYIHDFHKCRASPQAEAWGPSVPVLISKCAGTAFTARRTAYIFIILVSCILQYRDFSRTFLLPEPFFRPSPVHFTENTQIVEFLAIVMG